MMDSEGPSPAPGPFQPESARKSESEPLGDAAPPAPPTAQEPLSPPLPQESWLERNGAALALILCCLLILLPSSVALVAQAQVLRDIGTAVSSPSPPLDRELLLQKSPLMLAVAGVGLLGGVIMAGALLAALVSLRVRSWLSDQLNARPFRPLPALRLIDLLACYLVTETVGALVAAVVIGYLPRDRHAFIAVSIVIRALEFALAIVAAVWLARWRARSKEGSNGLWPFWRLLPENAPVSMWRDVLLGILAYPLIATLVWIATAINYFMAERLGVTPQDNPILGELSVKPPGYVLALLVVHATLGAAFFEELLFRGVLYNVLRRYLRGVVAAVGAALVFALAHRIAAQVLPLFVLGLVLIWLYERTGRLIASMTFHAVNNSVALAVALWLIYRQNG